MSEIGEQVKKLREVSDAFERTGFGVDGISKLLNEASDTIESLNSRLKAMESGGEWVDCDLEALPDKEVLCCDNQGEMIIGYVFGDVGSEETGFSAYNNHECMYNCVKWMEKPKP